MAAPVTERHMGLRVSCGEGLEECLTSEFISTGPLARSVWLCSQQATSLAWYSAPLTMRPTQTTCANTSLGQHTDVPAILILAQSPSGEALPAPCTYGGAQKIGWEWRGVPKLF